MKREDLFEAIGGIDEERLEQSEKNGKQHVVWLRYGSLAAGVCLVLLAGILLPRLIRMNVKNMDTSSADTVGEAYEDGQTNDMSGDAAVSMDDDGADVESAYANGESESMEDDAASSGSNSEETVGGEHDTAVFRFASADDVKQISDADLVYIAQNDYHTSDFFEEGDYAEINQYAIVTEDNQFFLQGDLNSTYVRQELDIWMERNAADGLMIYREVMETSDYYTYSYYTVGMIYGDYDLNDVAVLYHGIILVDKETHEIRKEECTEIKEVEIVGTAKSLDTWLE